MIIMIINLGGLLCMLGRHRVGIIIRLLRSKWGLMWIWTWVWIWRRIWRKVMLLNGISLMMRLFSKQIIRGYSRMDSVASKKIHNSNHKSIKMLIFSSTKKCIKSKRSSNHTKIKQTKPRSYKTIFLSLNNPPSPNHKHSRPNYPNQ